MAGLTAGVWAASIFGPRPAGRSSRPLCFTTHLPQPRRRQATCAHHTLPSGSRTLSSLPVFLPSPREEPGELGALSIPCPLSPPAAVPEMSSTRGVPTRVPGLRDHPQELRPHPVPTPAFCQPQQGAPSEWQYLLPREAEQGSWPPRSSLVLTAGPTRVLGAGQHSSWSEISVYPSARGLPSSVAADRVR